MAVEEALATLIAHFGDTAFRVRDMSDDMVDEVLDLGGDSIPGRYNRRMKVGVWLTQTGMDGTGRVEIVQRATDGLPGVYRVWST